MLPVLPKSVVISPTYNFTIKLSQTIDKLLRYLDVKLDIDVAFLSNHDSMFQMEMNDHNHFFVTWLKDGVFYILIKNINFISTLGSVAETVCVRFKIS